MAYSMSALSVQTRLIGCYHARKQSLAVEVLPYILRALMYIEEKADTMPRAMAEITSELP